MARVTLLLALLLLLSPSALVAQPGDAKGRPRLVERGRYLVAIMDCGGCHTPGSLGGKPDGSRALAGSAIGFGGPFGVVYPKNLTPDARALVAYLKSLAPIRFEVPRNAKPGEPPLAPYLAVVEPT